MTITDPKKGRSTKPLLTSEDARNILDVFGDERVIGALSFTDTNRGGARVHLPIRHTLHAHDISRKDSQHIARSFGVKEESLKSIFGRTDNSVYLFPLVAPLRLTAEGGEELDFPAGTAVAIIGSQASILTQKGTLMAESIQSYKSRVERRHDTGSIPADFQYVRQSPRDDLHVIDNMSPPANDSQHNIASDSFAFSKGNFAILAALALVIFKLFRRKRNHEARDEGAAPEQSDRRERRRGKRRTATTHHETPATAPPSQPEPPVAQTLPKLEQQVAFHKETILSLYSDISDPSQKEAFAQAFNITDNEMHLSLEIPLSSDKIRNALRTIYSDDKFTNRVDSLVNGPLRSVLFAESKSDLAGSVRRYQGDIMRLYRALPIGSEQASNFERALDIDFNTVHPRSSVTGHSVKVLLQSIAGCEDPRKYEEAVVDLAEKLGLKKFKYQKPEERQR